MHNALALIGLTLFLTRAAGAFCYLPQPRLVCAEYFKSQAVVVARLTGVHHFPSPDDVDYTIYTLRTEQVFRGAVGSAFRVRVDNDSGRPGFAWQVGESYVLFLESVTGSRAWFVDGCGNSGPTREAGETLKAIEGLRANPGPGGSIHGNARIDGVKVVAYGNRRALETVGDTDGNFVLQVPPGDYRIRATHPERTFSEAEFSYEHARHVHIENGGCAQVQFDTQLKSGP